VAELVADDLDVDAAFQRDACRRVPGIVEPHHRQTTLTGQLPEALGDTAAVG
jgi:hypothetical protein